MREMHMREIWGEQFAGAEKFLDSATYGLPSRRQTDALRTALDDWESGTQDTSAFDEAVDAARSAFAELVGAPTDSVTIGSTTSALVGLIAAAVPDSGRVAVQRGEFTSVTAPFATQAARGVTVEQFDPGTLEASVEEAVQASARSPKKAFDLVAVSLVQSADGRVLDTERLRRAVAGTHTRVVIDVTQAVGWKTIDLGWADAVVASGYKWLLAPRGTAWMALADSLAKTLIPHTAGWYSSETPWANTYEHPPLLAADARRFDASPAWHPMLGSGISLPWLASLDMREVEAHCVGLANRVREAAGMEPADSAIAALDVPGIEAAVADAGIRAAVRAGRVRVGFHLYNTTTDADAFIGALRRVR
ncbi:aminotransferase class V-fold PLP-dependent enzyme [Brevibacterium yomogidense]|nr:aminotransferase class V-fold PLP-dependent enzyme [Brevibacterium yomogidense]